SGIVVLGAVATAILIQIWFFHATNGEDLLKNLSVPLLFTLALSIAAAVRAIAPVNADEDEAAVVGANFVALAGLLGCLGSAELGADPRPLFAALFVGVVLLLASALRRDWTWLVPLALVASAAYATIWHESYFHRDDAPVALPIYAGFYFFFLI